MCVVEECLLEIRAKKEAKMYDEEIDQELNQISEFLRLFYKEDDGYFLVACKREIIKRHKSFNRFQKTKHFRLLFYVMDRHAYKGEGIYFSLNCYKQGFWKIRSRTDHLSLLRGLYFQINDSNELENKIVESIGVASCVIQHGPQERTLIYLFDVPQEIKMLARYENLQIAFNDYFALDVEYDVNALLRLPFSINEGYGYGVSYKLSEYRYSFKALEEKIKI